MACLVRSYRLVVIYVETERTFIDKFIYFISFHFILQICFRNNVAVPVRLPDYMTLKEISEEPLFFNWWS